MLKNTYFIFFLFFFSLLGLSFAQENTNTFSFVSAKEGISKRAVFTITEDQYGILWIGTNGAGLIRYNGLDYDSYVYNWEDESTVDSNVIYATYLDDKNQLWVGTDSGLNLYNRNLDKFERIDLSLAPNQNTSVQCINQDNDGNLILGVLNFGVLKLQTAPFKVFKTELSNLTSTNNFSINGFAKNSKGEIFVATNRGLRVINDTKNTLDKITNINKNDTIKTNEPLKSIIVDNDDNLWLGSNIKGLFKISNSNGKYQVESFHISDKRIMSLLKTEDNKILCGTENDGLISVDYNGHVIEKYIYNKFDKNSLKSNSIWSMCLDSKKRIWLGYYNKGIAVYDKLYNKFNSLESLPNINSLQASSVTGIAKEKSGNLWISMEGGGVDIYNPFNNTFRHANSQNEKHYKNLNSDDLQTVCIDSDENVWLGSWSGGIYYLKKGTNTFVNYNSSNTSEGLSSNRILSITEDAKGIIWIGTFLKGLHYYDPKLEVFKHCNSHPFKSQGLTSSDVRVILASSNNNLWVGTTAGLFMVNKNQDNSFTVTSMLEPMSAKLKNHLSTHQILSLYESEDKRLWIGTDGGGIFTYDPKFKTFETLHDIKNFKETSISSIIESDDGNIWVGGKSGIINIDLKTKIAKNYTVVDGLLSNDFNNNAVLKDENGVLYFGSYLGVNYFNPNNIPVNKNEPTLYFTDFKIFNKEVIPNEKNSPLNKVISETENITLNHNQSVFTIEYAGINHTRPEKNEYAYYLEGLDPNWNHVGHIKSATYTNLAPGDYVFKVKSSNNDGIWNTSPLELNITIFPPWWKTNIAYLIYFILLILSLFLFNRFVRNRSKQKQAIQFEKDKRIQEEKLNQKKIQFFTNISHEFRTPLTLIINPMADIISNKSLKLPTEVRKKHQIIYKNSDRLSRLINELMDFRKLQSNKIQLEAKEVKVYELVADYVNYFENEANHRKINLNYFQNTDKPTAWIDPDMLEKIIFNLISNAFKVTPDNGTIIVRANKLDAPTPFPLIKNKNNTREAIEISVEDTGPGLEQKEYKRIFERFYQVGRVNRTYYGSTGIGLELVKEFVELHKGKIVIESIMGKGTTFKIIFPLSKSHLSENDIVVDNDDIENSIIKRKPKTLTFEHPDFEEKEISKENENILLIVEDNVDLQDYLKNELKKSYKIITANNGAIGIELAKKHLPNIIITDVVMPLMNGLELCENIKNNLETSHIPLLMLTSKTMVKDKLKGINSGADAYINKPFDMSILKSTLSQLLTSRQILFTKKYKSITKESKNKTTNLDNVFIKKILKFINENISETDLSVELLASKLFLSRSQLYRKVKALTGISVNMFIRDVRLEKAKELLELGEDNISEVSYKVGFTSPSYFTKCFKAKYGYLPTKISNN